MTIEDFYYKLQDHNEYGRLYLKHIRTATVDETKVVEVHHIQPRALGGSNCQDNLIRLNTYDHILAHIYLSRALPCKETLLPLTWMARKNLKQLSEQEKISLDEVQEWADLREAAKKASSTLLRTPEAKRKAVQNSQKARAEKYGNCAAFLHTKEVREKALNTIAEKYGGDRAGQFHTSEAVQKSIATRKRKAQEEGRGMCDHLHTPEIRQKIQESIRQTNLERYGSPRGVLDRPEVREKAVQNSRKTRIEKYGGITKMMMTPEAIQKREAAKKITRQYQLMMKEAPEFQQWLTSHPERTGGWLRNIRAFLGDYGVKSCKEFLETHGYDTSSITQRTFNSAGESSSSRS